MANSKFQKMLIKIFLFSPIQIACVYICFCHVKLFVRRIIFSLEDEKYHLESGVVSYCMNVRSIQISSRKAVS